MVPSIPGSRVINARAPDFSYDAVIIGAGPAGCMAAVRAPGHMRILLADRLALPRDVICGGILLPSVLEMTAGIPPNDEIFSRPRKFNWTLYDGRLQRGGPLTDTVYYNIDRSHFDKWLYEAASTRGNVDVWPRTTFLSLYEDGQGKLMVDLLRQGHTVTVSTDNLVGADGARSNVRRLIGMPDTECWTTVQSRIRSEGKKVDRMLAFLNRDIDHYGWVVPKDGHVLIGLGVNRKNDYREAFRAFRTMLEKQHGIFGPDVDRLRSRHVTRLRSWREIYPGRGRILLAGEAAGLICPWSGEGISSAVFSGGLAGSLLSQHSPLRKYKRHLMLQIPRRIFNQIGYQTMTRPWACRLMALAIPGNDFRPLGELRQR